MPHGFGKYYYKDFIIKGIWRHGNNVEISYIEKRDYNNFNYDDLKFETKSFSLLPHMLPNLGKVDSKIDRFAVGTTPSYLNTGN